MGVLKLASFQVCPVASVLRLIMILAGGAGSYSGARVACASPAPRNSSCRRARTRRASSVCRAVEPAVRSDSFDAADRPQAFRRARRIIVLQLLNKPTVNASDKVFRRPERFRRYVTTFAPKHASGTVNVDDVVYLGCS